MNEINEVPGEELEGEDLAAGANDVTEEPEAAEEQSAESSDDVDIGALQTRAQRADELEDRLRRAEAEFMNETKRLRRLAENDAKFAVESVVVELVPLIDALHSAGTGLGESEAAKNMREGLDLVSKQLLGVLHKHGVEPIDAEGEAFDPSRHEAIYVRELPDVEPDQVIEVLRPGFSLHGRVIRPVEVGVSKAPVSAPEAASDESSDDPAEGGA